MEPQISRDAINSNKFPSEGVNFYGVRITGKDNIEKYLEKI